MLLFDAIKTFTVFALVLLFFSSCRTGQNSENQTSESARLTAEQLKNSAPFSTKEPENFQTEIVISANNRERKTFVARRGNDRRHDFDFGAENQVTALQTDKNYLILPEKRIYAEHTTAEIAEPLDEMTGFLTNKLLNSDTKAVFEQIATEENITAYRVRAENGESSEILIYIDETKGFPVRQEFYSIGNGQKSLNFRFELQNTKIPADDDLFVIPNGYQRVSEEDFRKTLSGMTP